MPRDRRRELDSSNECKQTKGEYATEMDTAGNAWDRTNGTAATPKWLGYVVES